LTDRQFNRAIVVVVGSVVRVRRGFSVVMGWFARLTRDFRAGADAKVAARGQAGGAGTSLPGVAHG